MRQGYCWDQRYDWLLMREQLQVQSVPRPPAPIAAQIPLSLPHALPASALPFNARLPMHTAHLGIWLFTSRSYRTFLLRFLLIASRFSSYFFSSFEREILDSDLKVSLCQLRRQLHMGTFWPQ